jgi:glutamate/tyrosine decarboxylase-like PLP-dependent enzyme
MSHAALLETASRLAIKYLERVGDRHVGGRASRGELMAALGGPLPERGGNGVAVLEQMAKAADAGLVGTPGPRYFGFVTGGSLPVTVAADWLASTWDQNGALYVMSPAVAVLEDIVAQWLLELLQLPSTASVGFVSGAHMANFTCLAAARHEVLHRVWWNVEELGLQNAPKIRIVVGNEVHVSVIGALRMLGFGAREPIRVAVDAHGRMKADALAWALDEIEGPIIVCAQAGNVNTGSSDPLRAIVTAAHEHGAWVHVDGAFGLWAAAVPQLRPQVDGLALADSWTTDAHKWLNVPYDSGLAIVAHAAPHRASMSLHASYLVRGEEEERVGMDWVPESSRRARVVPLYALCRTLGRDGLQQMVLRNCTLARRMADTLRAEPGIEILNDVVLNQVLVRFGDSDRITRDVITRVQADGTCWVGGAFWQGRDVMRISVSNWSTTEDDIDRSAEAMVRAFRASLPVPS